MAKQKCRLFTRHDIDRIPQLRRLPESYRRAMKVISVVLPFRVNNYVIEELIDWSAVPDDPIFRMVFPQPGMVPPDELPRLEALIQDGASPDELLRAAAVVQGKLNAQPGDQKLLNVPFLDGRPVPGLQHKYPETVLFFPSAGQSCHTHCMYCFRWAQFTSTPGGRFEHHETGLLVRYLRAHPEVTDVLITGGDPLVMGAPVLRQYLEPLLDPSLVNLRTIRIGTKSLSYWPHRFTTDDDADGVLDVFRDVLRSGRHLALMAHFTHPRELSTPGVRAALKRVRATGAVIRSQAPIVRGVNDNPRTWTELWRGQVRRGVVPYYMFVARDTGAQRYFRIPLLEALDTYRKAFRSVSGLGRTARGPVMSAAPGKILVDGVSRVRGEDVMVLKFIQGRDPSWVGRPFFAALDPRACWLSDLKPAFGEVEFFFEEPFRLMVEGRKTAWGRRAGHVHWHRPPSAGSYAEGPSLSGGE